MKYQIAIFHPAGECWNLHREDYKLVSFEALDEAEKRAVELSVVHPRCQILVITIHCGYKTETEYPKPEPITKTERVTV